MKNLVIRKTSVSGRIATTLKARTRWVRIRDMIDEGKTLDVIITAVGTTKGGLGSILKRETGSSSLEGIPR